MFWFILAVMAASIIGAATNTLNSIINLLFLVATIIFFWGIVKFIAKADNPRELAKAKAFILWGIIGLAVIASAWGVATIIIQYFLGSTSVLGIPLKPGDIP